MVDFPWMRPIPQGSSGGGSQTSTTQVQLPAWLDQAAQSELANAQTIAARPYQQNPNQQVVPVTADQTQAYNEVQQAQGATAPAYQASEGALTGLLGSAQPETAAGLSSDTAALMNPYTSAVVNPSVQLMQQQLGQSMAGNAAQAANVGAFGGSRLGVQQGVAQSQEALQAGQLAGGLLQSGYNTALGSAQQMENTNLSAGMSAAQLLPQVASAGQQQTLQDASALQGVGALQQNQAQQVANLSAQQWQDQFDWPLTGQSILQSALAATPYGQTTTSTQPLKSNTAAGVLGGAASGAALGSMIMPGFGTAVGAAGGGLLGLFN